MGKILCNPTALYVCRYRVLIEGFARQMVALFDCSAICKNYPDLVEINVAQEWDDWAYQIFCSS